MRSDQRVLFTKVGSYSQWFDCFSTTFKLKQRKLIKLFSFGQCWLSRQVWNRHYRYDTSNFCNGLKWKNAYLPFSFILSLAIWRGVFLTWRVFAFTSAPLSIKKLIISALPKIYENCWNPNKNFFFIFRSTVYNSGLHNAMLCNRLDPFHLFHLNILLNTLLFLCDLGIVTNDEIIF